MKEIKLPSGTSLLDYLWQNFGGYKVSSVIEGKSDDTLLSESAIVQYVLDNKHYETLVTETKDGLMSSDDKVFLDSIPEVYATKELLEDAIVGYFQHKGTKSFYGDLDLDAKLGDTWTIMYPFTLDGIRYDSYTSVIWLYKWVPINEGNLKGLYVSWEIDGETKVIVLPENSAIYGTDNGNLITLIKAIDGYVLIGDNNASLNIYSNTRPLVTEGDNILYLAYLSDIGVIDLENYPSDSVITYIPELTLEFLDTMGAPDNIYGDYLLNLSYLVVTHDGVYDLYNVDKYVPNNILPIIKYMREEYLNSLTFNTYE